MFDLANILAKINAFEQLVAAILTLAHETKASVDALQADVAETRRLVANLAPAQISDHAEQLGAMASQLGELHAALVADVTPAADDTAQG